MGDAPPDLAEAPAAPRVPFFRARSAQISEAQRQDEIQRDAAADSPSSTWVAVDPNAAPPPPPPPTAVAVRPPSEPPRALPSPFSVYSSNAITVHPNQRNNPVLQHIRTVAWEFGEIVPDYIVGRTACVLFLSLRYHRLHPEYIYNRLKSLRREYSLRVLLVQVDVEDHVVSLTELSKLSLVNSFTIVLAWSVEEAGRYLETFKAYEKKPPDALKGRVSTDYMSQLSDALTSVRSVNKTDVVTLSSTFGVRRMLLEK